MDTTTSPGFAPPAFAGDAYLVAGGRICFYKLRKNFHRKNVRASLDFEHRFGRATCSAPRAYRDFLYNLHEV